MELIFKKYHTSELHTEKNYLIYDPSRNQAQFTNDLFKSISLRNFGQSYENILIGPIMKDKKMTVKVLTSDGAEAPLSPNTQKIFRAYLKDQGYPVSALSDGGPSESKSTEPAHIRQFGTVYYFPA